MAPADPPPLIVLLTDFGLRDAYAGVLKGVIVGIAPQARVVDLCHALPPQDVAAGAFVLLTAYRYFPPDTIFVCVVDPGVGTERAIVAVEAAGQRFIGPDNGLLRWAVDDAGGASAIVRVEHAPYRLAMVSRTFHGRDIMAPAAAHLANGVPLDSLGPRQAALAGDPFPSVVRHSDGLTGQVIYIDHYGNCVTSLRGSDVRDSMAEIVVSGRPVRLAQTYGAVAAGEPLALVGSSGFLEIAVANGSARDTLGIGVGTQVTLVATQTS